MNLTSCIHKFFSRYLPEIKGVSSQTIQSYRDTFRIFLPFAAEYYSIKIKSLKVEHLTFDLMLDFLEQLEKERNNKTRTRNQRLEALRSFAKMIKIIYPEHKDIAERILSIPQKRAQKTLIGYLDHQEVIKVFDSVDLKRTDGFRNLTILNLLYDSGARASEIAELDLAYFNPGNKTLSILGKGNRFRLVELWPRTVSMIERYIHEHRSKPKPVYMNSLFISQRGEAFTRFGINKICKKYLHSALPEKRLRYINPVHSFRHSCAVNMLKDGYSVTDIQNHLGHENIQATMTYLKLEISRKREIQNEFRKFTRSVFKENSELNELIDWDNKEDILTWLDKL